MLDPNEFVNRNKELEQFKNAYSDADCRIFYIEAQPRSGSTSFLQYLFTTYKKLNSVAIYLRLCEETSLLAQSLREADVSGLKEEAKRLKKDMLRISETDKGASAAREAIPALGAGIIGAAIAALVPNEIAGFMTAILSEGFFRGCYDFVDRSAVPKAELGESKRELSLLRRLFSKYRGKEVLLLIDGADYLLEPCYDEIKVLLESTSALRVVLCFHIEHDSVAIETAQSRLGNLPTTRKIKINPPSFEMFNLMADNRGCVLDPDSRRHLWAGCGGDVYKMDCRLKSNNNSIQNSVETIDCALWAVQRSPTILSPFDLYCILRIPFLDESDDSGLVDDLETLGLIEVRQGMIYPATEAVPKISDAESLLIDEMILELHMPRIAQLNERQLERLVSISRRIYPNSLLPVQPLLVRFLSLTIPEGRSSLSKSEVELALPESESSSVLLRTNYYFVTNDYDTAYSYLSQHSQLVAQNERLSLLWGITLNRVRKQAEAEKVLGKLEDGGSTTDIRAIAAAYLIANRIYSGDTSGAYRLYLNRHRHFYSPYYPYIVRNAASLLRYNDGVMSELDTILDRGTADEFCKATIVCVKGRAAIEHGDYPKAKTLFEEAERGMATFLFRNQAVVKNDLALTYMMMGDIDAAEKKAHEALRFSIGEAPYHRMQVLTIKINIAVILAKRDPASGVRELKRFEEEAESYPIETLRALYWQSRALVEALSNSPSLEQAIGRMLAYSDPLNKDRGEKLAQLFRENSSGALRSRNRLWDLGYAPACLVFWYVSPLGLTAL